MKLFREEETQAYTFKEYWLCVFDQSERELHTLTKLEPIEITEEEIGAEILPYLIEFDPYIDWSELPDRLSKAIKKLLNK